MAASYSPLAGLQSFQLDNGLRVYFQREPRYPLVSVQAWVRVGSVDETDADAGLSHVLEHMVFKGTARRQASDISRWVEALGGSMNAETSREYTHYYIDVPGEGARQAIELMGELLHGATLQPEEWRRECPVILEEIKRRNDDPEAVLWDLLNGVLFQEPRLSRPVIGYPRTVQEVTRERLDAFYHEHYTADQAVLVVTGDFMEKSLRPWIRRAFRAMPSGTRQRRILEAGTPPAVKDRVVHQPVQQAYVALGFPTPLGTHRDQETLDVLAGVLGEGRGSRLINTLQETKKLVWSISAANLTHEGPGIFGVFADCEKSLRPRVMDEIVKLLKGLQKSPPTPAELRRAKNLLQTSWLQGFETIHGRAATIGSFALEDHLDRLETYLPKLLSVTPRQLEDAIQTYLSAGDFSTAVIEAP